MHRKMVCTVKNFIKAVVIDIDGCLTSKDFGQSLDLESLKHIQEISRNYLRDPATPMLVLNTGRDMNHTEMMAKIINAFHYLIIEAGAALVSVHGAQLRYLFHDSINTDSLRQFEELYRQFLSQHKEYVKYLQHGKRYMVTFLFETGDPVKTSCATALQQFIRDHEMRFTVDEGHNFVNVMFPGVDKGTGLELLFNANPELSPENIAGIGDSASDWAFMQRCAFNATPSNGSDILKEKCDYVASSNDARGTLEILRHVIARNRFLLQAQRAREKQPAVLVKAVLTDINGTIDSAAFGNALDLDKIGRMRDIVALAGRDPGVPHLWLNTGWDLNYTILYAQLLNVPKYHIIERGAAIVSVDGPFVHETTDSRITEDIVGKIAQVQLDFIKEHPHYYKNLQLGKKYTISFQFELGSEEKHDCLKLMQEFLHENGISLDIEEGPNFFNVGVPGIDKGTGAAILVKMVGGIDFGSIVGIGDSDGDWSYMQMCGFTACPSKASRFLREHCDYVATKPETEGTLEILEKIVQWNIGFTGLASNTAGTSRSRP